MNSFSIHSFKKNFDILLHKDLSRRDHKEIVEPGNKQLQKVESSFQSVMKVPIMIAQCFGLFPVIGFSGIDASTLSFTYCSRRYLYSMVTILGQTIILVFSAIKMFNRKTQFLENSITVFYFMTAVIGLLFLRMAIKWPKLCKRIAKTEAADPVRDKNLTKNCKIACILVLSLATVEHILSDVSGVAIAMDYHPNTPIYEAYMLQSYPFVWTYIPYNPVIGFMLKIISIQCTFNWNFADAFIMCISYYLTARLQQINDRIVAVKGKYAPVSFYRTVREDYSRIIRLIRKIDEDVNGVIFVSYAVNLFIICMQLLHTLEPMQGYSQAVYFIYSFAFLLARSLAVSLIASKVHTASRIPADYLYDVPSSSYCTELEEVQRFLNQVHGDEVALTGMQFFNVKRGLVLTISASTTLAQIREFHVDTITGTIITYELVLVQFAGVVPNLQPTTVTATT